MLQVCAALASIALSAVLFPLPAGLLVGACSIPLAVRSAGRLHDRPPRRPDPADAPLVLALIAAALRAGLPVPAAIELAAPAARDPAPLMRVAGLLRLGASSEEAWSVLAADGGWSTVRVLAGRSGHSGIRLADACERSSAELLAQLRATAVVRAQRVSVLAVGPLGGCFLPAFVCLGIVPVLAGAMFSLWNMVGENR